MTLFADVARDLRHGLRLVRREPGYAALAIVTMAVGIGATTTLFSVAYGVLLKPLPWAAAERLVRVTETRQGRTGRVRGTVSNATYHAWREQPSTIEDVGGWMTQTVTMTAEGDPVRLAIVPTTPSLFPLLRVRPTLGRLFDDRDGLPGQTGSVILSYGLWQERFGGDPNVIGRTLQFDDKLHTVVGVMPREFSFPDRETRAWTAWSVSRVQTPSGMLVGVIFRAIARLRDGATPAQASAEATGRARGAPDMGPAGRALFGATGPIDVVTEPELQALTAEVRPAIVLLLAGVALLLVTATANVAGLQLARATTRQREMAVRAAIGARRGRIVAQLIAENGVIAVGGGIGGIALAAGLLRLLPALLPAGFPRIDAVAMDLHVLGFALTTSLLASLVCGLMPAWRIARVSLTEALSQENVASIAGVTLTPMARARAFIIVGQVAIACVLLVVAALLSRSFVSLVRADRGYDPLHVLTARLPFPSGYGLERERQVADALLERVRALPGVMQAAYGTALPFVSLGGFTAFTMRSPRNPGVELNVQAAQRVVTPSYFAAMGLRLIEGRILNDSDTPSTTPAVVINRTFVRQYLGDHPVGFHIPQRGARAGGIRFADERAEWEVVGVVDDTRADVDSPPQPEIYASIRQITPRSTNFDFNPIFVIRTADDPTTYAPVFKRLTHEAAPALALDSIMTMEDRVMESLAKPRLYAVVLVSFAVFALLIAAVGLFAVLSFTVAQRTREIGVRAALGAQAHDIVMLVLTQALGVVAIGVALGLAVAAAGVRVLSTFLYGIGAHDTLTFVGAPVLVVTVAGIACLVPARRATKVDPLTALRTG